jgi:hypothetical protein
MAVSAFCNQLVRFFEELNVTFPDERDIKSGLEVIQGARKINPRMVLDMFYEHVAKDLTTAIMNDDVDSVIKFGRAKIHGTFNEMMPALAIFDKHWATLSSANREAIWKYLKVLVILCEKARNA